LTPFVASFLPIIGLLSRSPWTEWTFLSTSLGASATTLVRGCARVHRRWLAMAPFLAGVVVLVAGKLVEDAYPSLTRIGVVIGAGLVIAAHALNIRQCRRAGSSDCCRLDGTRLALAPRRCP
jgi:hypothetical protein